jgi:hypothetical protein
MIDPARPDSPPRDAAEIERELDELIAKMESNGRSTPTPPAAPTPAPAHQLPFTYDELRDPNFIMRPDNQAKLLQWSEAVAHTPIDRLGSTAPATPAPVASPPTNGRIRVTQQQLRDPQWCFSPEGQAILQQASDRVHHLPITQVGDVFEIV